MKSKRKATTDALEILDRRYFHDRHERLSEVEESTLNARIALEIYPLRTKAGLTQQQLAKRVGTTHSVISRLEDAAYSGHSLTMLVRISRALGTEVEIRFVPARRKRKTA